jgi:hypothetical protein
MPVVDRKFGFEGAKGISLYGLAYENRTTNNLTLSFKASTSLSIHSTSYPLFDIHEKLLES